MIRNPLINSKGINTSGIRTVLMQLVKILEEDKPEFLAIAADGPEATFRHKRYPEYKATREKMPEDLVEQLPFLPRAVEALNLPYLLIPGYEADDIIGTLMRLCRERNIRGVMVTSDKDYLQLISETTEMLNHRNELIGLAGVEVLKPYRFADFQFMGQTMLVSRTGFTGDLGYELWIAPEQALRLWDALFDAGRHYGIRAFGTEALEVARIEAGFIQAGVDFVPAQDAIRTDRTRSPYEVGLGWLVDLKKHAFNGRRALMAERQQGSRFNLVKLIIEGNKPANNSFVFDAKGRHIGTVTSACWSPTTKSNLALASLNAPWGKAGDEMVAEIYYLSELKWERVMARCSITETSFFDPKRRHTTPPGEF